MIAIIAKSVYREGTHDTVMPLLDELIAKSRREEGCLRYELLQAIDDRKVLTFVEEWADEDAIRRHNASEHFTRIVPLLSQYRTSSSEVVRYNRIS